MANLFVAEGISVPAVTAEQMREIDRIAVEETGPNLYQMMENAGRNLAMLTMELLGKDWNKANIVVLAGTGGNGGGGICAARHLANRGARVNLCLANSEKLAEVTRFQRKIYQNTSGKEVVPQNLKDERVDFILDAIIGYSLTGAPRGAALELIRWANETNQPILSLDLPSGLDATTGEAAGEFVRANWTLTLALPKTGLAQGKAGELFLADIGIPQKTFERIGLQYEAPYGRQYYTKLKN